ncbi:MAG: flagellar basal body-associated FliL family protein [Deferribacterota bacterium]|nr:flagellar basal body-associated FliL family protein [Deferribacterota bacterium]
MNRDLFKILAFIFIFLLLVLIIFHNNKWFSKNIFGVLSEINTSNYFKKTSKNSGVFYAYSSNITKINGKPAVTLKNLTAPSKDSDGYFTLDITFLLSDSKYVEIFNKHIDNIAAIIKEALNNFKYSYISDDKGKEYFKKHLKKKINNWLKNNYNIESPNIVEKIYLESIIYS